MLLMPRWPGAALMVGLAWASCAAFGAEVSFTLSARETYVGAPVQVQVIIKRAQEHQPPDFPEIEGAEVRRLRSDDRGYARISQPRREQRLAIVYTYAVIPLRAGTLTIPPIRVVADGESFSTLPMRIVAKESEAGDLLFLRLVGDRESAYVGEPIDVTLEIWLKPYRTNTIRMDAEDMWLHAIDERASVWGAFIENLRGQVPSITYPLDITPDPHGTGQQYFVYRLSRRVWPERAGVFDAGGVSVVVHYPLRVRRNQLARVGDPHEVVESRPISAVIKDSSIVVKAPPAEGQPDSFRGAMGTYTMSMTAAPTKVSVGDPITLTMTIRGTGRMDWLQAPLLARQEQLTADFQVPETEPAGTVNGMAKEFTHVIRAKRADVTEVRPIEFSYFDPQDERYVTLKSAPIPLNVKQSLELVVSQAADDIARAAVRTELTPLESGLLANYDDIESLLSRQSFSFGWGAWVLTVSGPLLYLTSFMIRRHRDRITGDAGFKRRRSARKRAIVMIRHTRAEASGAVAASRIAAAVTGYVADRCNLPGGSATRNEIIDHLRLHSVPEALIDKIDALLAECEEAQYAAAQDASADDYAERARSCVNELERQRF
ncbi:MAG: BatD family protein [Planctomycetes bacterium]|nr:BatD family protein [Planctomycetota bacterium]